MGVFGGRGLVTVLVMGAAACGASSDEVAACLAQTQRVQSEHAALRGEVAALSERLARAEATQRELHARVAEGEAVAVGAAAPLTPAPDPAASGEPSRPDANAACAGIESEKLVTACKQYKPQGLAWRNASAAAQFADPRAPAACSQENVCMILTYSDKKQYDKTKELAKSLAGAADPGATSAKDGIAIFVDDERLLVLKVDLGISAETLAKVTAKLKVRRVEGD